ncbi:MAG: hypothetical protein ABJC04_01475 [Verrucomicrobiota bacterium]
MLDVTAMRQEAIASNLANLETPNHKRIDVSASESGTTPDAESIGISCDNLFGQPQFIISPTPDDAISPPGIENGQFLSTMASA